MLALEKFSTGRNLHSTFNPIVTAVFGFIAFAIISNGLSWSRASHDWRLLVSILLIVLLIMAFIAILCGVVALKNRFTQIVYSLAIGGAATLFLNSQLHLTRENWHLFLAAACISTLVFYILRYLLSKPSILAACQCLLGTLTGIVLLSELIHFGNRLF